MKTTLTMLLCGALGAVAIGCGSDPAPTQTPTDSGTTNNPDASTTCSAPAAVDGRVPYYECSTTPICPRQRVMNSATSPGYRLTYLNIRQPTALANAAVGSVINTAVKKGTFLWGLKFDGNNFRTGGMNPANLMRGTAGLGLLDGTYSFFSNNAPGGMGTHFDPTSGSGTLMGDRYTSTPITTTVNIPIFTDETGTTLLTQLPLENAQFSNVQLTADHGCIGLGQPTAGRFTETTSNWLTEDGGMPYGVVEADITVEHSRTVTLTLGGQMIPLCNLVAGADCTTPQASWPNQPTMAMVNGMSVPVYHLRAEFAAVSANIQ